MKWQEALNREPLSTANRAQLCSLSFLFIKMYFPLLSNSCRIALGPVSIYGGLCSPLCVRGQYPYRPMFCCVCGELNLYSLVLALGVHL